MYRVVEPKRQRLNAAMSQLKEKQYQLQEAKDKLAEVRAELCRATKAKRRWAARQKRVVLWSHVLVIVAVLSDTPTKTGNLRSQNRTCFDGNCTFHRFFQCTELHRRHPDMFVVCSHLHIVKLPRWILFFSKYAATLGLEKASHFGKRATCKGMNMEPNYGFPSKPPVLQG